MIGRALLTLSDKNVSRWLLAALLVVLIVFPFVMGEQGRYYTVLLMTVFIFATIGHAWNLLAGFCGLLSFGIQVYIGLAGYTVAILTFYMNVPVWWAMLLSVLVTTAFAWIQAAPISGQFARRNTWIGVIAAIIVWVIYEIIIVYNPAADVYGGAYIRRVIFLFSIFLGALPLLKLQGAYFAVATWLIAAAVTSIFSEWRVVGAGGGMSIASDTTVTGRYFAGLILVVVATAVVWWLLHSRFGQALTAVRDDEEAATSIGIDIRLIKTMVFLISAPMAGLAASLHYIDAVSITPPDAFGIRWSAYAVFIVVAGGMGTLTGPIVGAIAFIVVQRFLVGLWGGGDLTLGISAVLLILLLPRGIVGWINDLRDTAAKLKSKPKVPNVAKTLRQPGSINRAILLPSSPAVHLLPGTADWQALRHASSQAIRSVISSNPDVIVFLTNTPGPFQEGRPKPRTSGQHRNSTFANFGDIAFDVCFNLQLAQELADAGLRIHLTDKADVLEDTSVVAAMALLGPSNSIPIVIVDLSSVTQSELARTGQTISNVVRDTGYNACVVGLSGLSGSVHPVDISSPPGSLASEEHDQANRQIVGWLQDGNAAEMLHKLPEMAAQVGLENRGAVLSVLQSISGTTATILNYSAIFGTGAAVVEFQMKVVK